MKFDIPWLVDTMDVPKGGGNRKVRGNGGEGFVDFKNILRLSVKCIIVNVFIVNTIFLTTSNSNFLNRWSAFYLSVDCCSLESYHLKPLLHWRRTF